MRELLDERQRLLALEYEYDGNDIQPEFICADELESTALPCESASGWIILPDKGATGPHGLPLRYAYLRTAPEGFREDMAVELFSVYCHCQPLPDKIVSPTDVERI